MLRVKPARKPTIRTSALVGLVFIVGCQQQVKPPVVEVPRMEQTTEAPELPVEPNEQPQIDVLPKQIDWNRGSREIARTEVSPMGPNSIQPTRQDSQAPQRKGAISVNTSTAIEPNETGSSEAIALAVIPSIKPIDETPAIAAQPTTSTYLRQPGSDREVIITGQPDENQLTIDDSVRTAADKLAENEPEMAILAINAISPKSLSSAQRAEVLRIKGEAYRQLDMSIAALRFDAERLRYLDNQTLNAAARNILEALADLPDPLRQDLSAGTDPLAGLAHAISLRMTPSEDAIWQWLRKYRAHPLLRAELPEYSFLTTVNPPKDFNVTVLLPLSGDLGNAGRAIRDGMLYEYQRQQFDFGVALRIIDTEKLSTTDMIAIGQSTNTEFIIGPLQKGKVVGLLDSKPRVPVLALNRVKTDALDLSTPVYSLSLAIEDDAQSTINYVARDVDQPRVLVFHSNSPLGMRAANAIQSQLTAVGGTSGGQFALDSKKPEIAIIAAFGVNDSNNRRQQLSKALGLRLEHTTRIRQDMTAVVIETDPKRAQQIRPLLDFYYLDKTPVYLIGAYRPDINEIAEDLRNSQLMVTPWDLGTEEKQMLADRTNAQGIFGSLVGIGIDAVRMAMQLGFGGSTSIPGQTGYLTLGPDSMIHRQLSTIRITNNQQVIATDWEPAPSQAHSELLHAN
ncbi:MAG: penicillin-binding protein activator [Pseudomonadota bacterium]|nr:penicillin-binding protein activator [Pseudomonadota bacterium]